ncbi:MAG TPA: NIL domain-containing protein [Acidimicrobiales bacterium]|nr:NIL domain-containing protein [Acidimicrobiales bacterium]
MSVRVRIVFPEDLVREPVLARLTRLYDVEPNIRRAQVEERSGWIICELVGESGAVEEAIEWLRSTGIRVEPLSDVVES